MENTNKTLTIIGATGKLAIHVIHRLLEKGVKITGVVRNIESAKKLLPEEVELVQGDVADLDSLKNALKGTQYIYINLSTTTLDQNLPFYTEREGVQNIVDAAKYNNVSQIMQIGGIESFRRDFALDGLKLKTSLIRDQGMEFIKNSGIPYTFFFCSFFLDSFPLYIQNKQFGIFGDLKHPLYYTNTTNLAKNIYQAIGNSKVYNKSFAVQGKDGVSFPDAAKRFVKIYDHEVVIEKYPIKALKEMGFPPEEEKFMTHMMTFVEQLKEEFVSENTWNELGKPEMDIESFAQALKDDQI